MIQRGESQEPAARSSDADLTDGEACLGDRATMAHAVICRQHLLSDANKGLRGVAVRRQASPSWIAQISCGVAGATRLQHDQLQQSSSRLRRSSVEQRATPEPGGLAWRPGLRAALANCEQAAASRPCGSRWWRVFKRASHMRKCGYAFFTFNIPWHTLTVARASPPSK